MDIKMSDDYNKSSSIQFNDGLPLVNELTKAIQEMNLQNPDRFKNNSDAFIICDLGCSMGLSSVQFLKAVLTEIKKINPALPIEVYLEDTPFNDFDLALKTVTAGLQEFTGVKYQALPKSFYEKLFENSSVDLFFSSYALHWLPEALFPQDEQFLYVCDDDKIIQKDYVKMEKYINDCWKQKMHLRAEELKPNGKFLFHVPFTGSDHHYNPKSIVKFRIARQAFNKVLQNNSCFELSNQMYIPATLINEHHLQEHTKVDFVIEDIVKLGSIPCIYKDTEEFLDVTCGYIKSYTFGIIKSVLAKNLKPEQVEKILSETIESWRKDLLQVENDDYSLYRQVIKVSVNPNRVIKNNK